MQGQGWRVSFGWPHRQRPQVASCLLLSTPPTSPRQEGAQAQYLVERRDLRFHQILVRVAHCPGETGQNGAGHMQRGGSVVGHWAHAASMVRVNSSQELSRSYPMSSTPGSSFPSVMPSRRRRSAIGGSPSRPTHSCSARIASPQEQQAQQAQCKAGRFSGRSGLPGLRRPAPEIDRRG